MRLVHDVQLTIGDDVFEMIRQDFAADVDSTHGVADRSAGVRRNDVREGEARVDNARGDGGGKTAVIGGGAQDGRRAAKERFELEFFECDLVQRFLYRREVETRFGEYE